MANICTHMYIAPWASRGKGREVTDVIGEGPVGEVVGRFRRDVDSLLAQGLQVVAPHT